MHTTCPRSSRDQTVLAALPAARRYLARRTAAGRVEDLVQDVALTMLAALDRGAAAVANPEAFAVGVAKNLLRNANRRRRAAAFTDVAADDDRPFDPAAPAPEPPAGLADDVAAFVQMAVATLPPADQALVHLRFTAGLSQNEIAAKLLASPQNVGRRMLHVYEQLRETLRVVA